MLLCVLCLGGCGYAPFAAKEVVSEGLFWRRVVVGNDWVYVKKDNALYRRYIPSRGIGPLRILRGNSVLLASLSSTKAPSFLSRFLKFDGKIVRWNKDIVVYGNYTKAIAAQPKAKISSESLKFVPVEKKAPEWWLKRRLQPDWQPGG
jgi:hypothetical protein